MEGLDKFREAFEAFSDNYVIIGGTACELVMTGSPVRPRATHDIDMIVIVEMMTPAFGQRFWDFIREAGYRPAKVCATDGGKTKYQVYRFVNSLPGYPEMIELLSRHPDVLGEPKDLLIEPLPFNGSISSLSAIIMDDDFYRFTIEHSILTDGIRHADTAALIALKACAYINLLNEKASGKHVNSQDIKKHRSDVLKNAVILRESEIKCPAKVTNVINDFVESILKDWDKLAQSLGDTLGADSRFAQELLHQIQNTFKTSEL